MRARGLSALLAALLFIVPAVSAEDGESPVREGLKDFGRGVRNVTRETGHAFRDAARDVKEATKDEREEVAEESGGVLSSLGKAFDELAAKIASWANDD